MVKGLAATCALIALSAQPTKSALLRIKRDSLCVTNGIVSMRPDGRLEIDTPSSRGVVRVASSLP